MRSERLPGERRKRRGAAAGAPRAGATAELPLVGPAGEAVDLRRTLVSHGCAQLPPMRIDGLAATLEVTLPLGTSGPRTIKIAPGREGSATVEILGERRGARLDRARAAARHLLRLDEDLSAFYDAASGDADLSWVRAGAGRMLRSPTVFEDVVKTICTTNCAWSATERMVTALVEHLGEPAPGALVSGWAGRAFPTPEAMARASDRFYRQEVRAGYRGAYLRQLARAVARGELDLESLGRTGADEIPDDELHARLIALPGVGPYAAAHVMLMLGRYSRLILDSWTRPTYARLTGKRRVADRTIQRRFGRHGRYAGLAFWMFLTRPWV